MISPSEIARLRAVVGAIPDPEIPVLCLDDLGMVRDLFSDAKGQLRVHITPTYSGCPATEWITSEVKQTLSANGHPDAYVSIVLDPPWTTDWMSASGAQKLRDYGIAPPACTASQHATQSSTSHNPTAPLAFQPRCPRCASAHTEEIASFGSTPCKSLYRCVSCREPFDYFKPF